MTVSNRPRTPSADSYSTVSSLKSPRTPRFAEATAVHSPLSPLQPIHMSFPQATAPIAKPQSPTGVTFGASIDRSKLNMEYYGEKQAPSSLIIPTSPLQSPPLRSALKTPGTAKTIFSPTFREERDLEKAESRTDRAQAKDLKVKTRVRIAKLLLRSVGFSCALIVLSMLTTVFTIFNATKALPPRYVGATKITPWASNQMKWPQITVLSIAAFTLLISIVIFWQYWRGGHKRVEKLQIWYSTFALFTFFFALVMWVVGATVLQHSKKNSNGQDLWAWSCNKNVRSVVYGNQVNYKLACRLQNWSMICSIISIIVELLIVGVYAVVIYRYYSLRRLRKSMGNRDKARSDLYLAQLRAQSAPNTPGFTLDPDRKDKDAEAGESSTTQQYAASNASPSSPLPLYAPKPFVLQPPPAARAQQITPQIQQTGFSPIHTTGGTPHAQALSSSPPPRSAAASASSDHGSDGRRTVSPAPPQSPAQETVREHVAAAPGEAVYDSVPIPGAYAGTPVQHQFSGR